MSALNSTLTTTTTESDEIIKPTTENSQQLSPLIIGMIVISVVAGIGLICLSFLLVRRNINRKHGDLESSTTTTTTTPNKKKRVFSLSSSTEKQVSNKDIPVTSSLDTHDVFFTILEYPPTKPLTSLQHNNNRLLEVPTNNTTCSSFSVYEERKMLMSMKDPISVSLARQSIEERSGYYKSPTRTPVPYYQHHQKQSSITSSSNSNNLIIVDEDEDEDDEDRKAIQRWSASSYHVW